MRIAANKIEPMPEVVIEGLCDLIRQEKLEHWDVIAIAAAALGEIGADAIPNLTELLYDNSYLVRLAAIAGLNS